MSDYKIVATIDLAQYQRRARMGTAMAIVALVSVVATAFVFGYYTGKVRTYDETSEKLDSLYKENNETVQTFIIAWENQQESIRLIESWATYIRGRQESIALNRGMVPIDRPPWKPHKEKGK